MALLQVSEAVEFSSHGTGDFITPAWRIIKKTSFVSLDPTILLPFFYLDTPP